MQLTKKKSVVEVDDLDAALAQSAGAVALFDTALFGLEQANTALDEVSITESQVIEEARDRLDAANAQINRNTVLAARIRKLVEP